MIIALELLGALIACGALIMVASTLLPAMTSESALLLAYVISAAISVFLCVFLFKLWRNPSEWQNVGLFLVVGLVAGAVASTFFWVAAGQLALVDSSHGGSVVIVVLATIGVTGCGAVCSSEKMRRGGAL